MDDVVNRFARELADAIAAAVAENPQVEACREKARAAGFEMKVTLEAVVGFVSRSQIGGAGQSDDAPAPRGRSRGAPSRSPPTIAASFDRCASRRTKRRNRSNKHESGIRIRLESEFVEGRRASCAGLFYFCARLIGHPRGGRRGGGGIAQVVVADRLQVVVELVDERDAGRDVQLDDVGCRRCRPDTSRARAGCCRARRSARAGRRGSPARSCRASRAGSGRPCPSATRSAAARPASSAA